MKLYLYDPAPWKNEYVTKMFFRPMREYARNSGVEFSEIENMENVSGEAIIANLDHVTPNAAEAMRRNSCRVIAFNCIDSAALSGQAKYANYLLGLHRIFTLSGIQTKNYSLETTLDESLGLLTEKKMFLPPKHWTNYRELHRTKVLQSLPYVPWSLPPIPGRKQFNERRPTILFRGGNHIFRFLAYLMAMRNNSADGASGFHIRDYFRDEMTPQFRYCDACRTTFKAEGRYPYTEDNNSNGCSSPVAWGNGFDPKEPWHWNNKCPKSFYWLSRKFSERHGAVDLLQVANALNYTGATDEAHLKIVGEVRYYADAKWAFTINAAQRFWQGACVGTVNYLPERTADQEYFPDIQPGIHYRTFRDDFSDINAEAEPASFDQIADNAYRLYEKWIHPSDYAISTNLLDHIFKLIME